jgi:seryl-tRNA synthetase
MSAPTMVESFRDELLSAGLLLVTGVDGIYHRSGVFEAIVHGISEVAHRSGSDQNAELRYLPPVMPRADFELTGYLRSFPNLMGSVATFSGNDREHAELLGIAESGGDWARMLAPTESMLASAACHSLYATIGRTAPSAGQRFEIEGYCFRNEPSLDPARMQSFRMREFVFVGTPNAAIAHRDLWIDRGLSLLAGLGLAVEAVPANDPFFGRAGRLLASDQLDSGLKYEIVVPIASAEVPTAISSANYHLDHFGESFDIRTDNGEVAHSACFGFGLERIALALLRTHGLAVERWPSAVKQQVQL